MKLDITLQERDELLRLVDNYFLETRVEVRHTQNRDYREQLHQEEDLLRMLQEKLKKLTDTDPTRAVA